MISLIPLVITILIVGGIVGLCVLGLYLLSRLSLDPEKWYNKPIFHGEPDYVKVQRELDRLGEVRSMDVRE